MADEKKYDFSAFQEQPTTEKKYDFSAFSDRQGAQPHYQSVNEALAEDQKQRVESAGEKPEDVYKVTGTDTSTPGQFAPTKKYKSGIEDVILAAPTAAVEGAKTVKKIVKEDIPLMIATQGAPLSITVPQHLEFLKDVGSSVMGLLNAFPVVAGITTGIKGVQEGVKKLPEGTKIPLPFDEGQHIEAKELVKRATAPINTIIQENFPNSLKNPIVQNIADIGDMIAPILVTGLAAKGEVKLAKDINEDKPISGKDANKVVEFAESMTPKDVRDYAHQTVVNNLHEDIAPIADQNIKLTQDHAAAAQVLGKENADQIFAPKIQETQQNLQQQAANLDAKQKLEAAKEAVPNEEGKALIDQHIKTIDESINKLNPKTDATTATKSDQGTDAKAQPINEGGNKPAADAGAEEKTIKIGGKDAVQKPSAEGVDVRQPPTDGKKVGEGNAQEKTAEARKEKMIPADTPLKEGEFTDDMSDKDLKGLREEMDKNGMKNVAPIIVEEGTNKILDGNKRNLVADAAGVEEKKVQYVPEGTTVEEAQKINSENEKASSEAKTKEEVKKVDDGKSKEKGQDEAQNEEGLLKSSSGIKGESKPVSEETPLKENTKIVFEKKRGRGMSKKPFKAEGIIVGTEKDGEGNLLYDVRHELNGRTTSTLVSPDEIVKSEESKPDRTSITTAEQAHDFAKANNFNAANHLIETFKNEYPEIYDKIAKEKEREPYIQDLPAKELGQILSKKKEAPAKAEEKPTTGKKIEPNKKVKKESSLDKGIRETKEANKANTEAHRKADILIQSVKPEFREFAQKLKDWYNDNGRKPEITNDKEKQNIFHLFKLIYSGWDNKTIDEQLKQHVKAINFYGNDKPITTKQFLESIVNQKVSGDADIKKDAVKLNAHNLSTDEVIQKGKDFIKQNSEKPSLSEIKSKVIKKAPEAKASEGKSSKQSAKDQIAKGVTNAVGKFSNKKSLLPEEKTKLYDDIKDIVEGVVKLGGITIKEAISHAVESIKNSDWYKAMTKEDQADVDGVVERLGEEKEGEPTAETKGITKEELKSEWDNIGIDSEFKDGLKQDFGKLADDAKADIESGKSNVDELAQEYADNINKPVNDKTIALLLTRKRQLQNAIEDVNKQREATTDEAEIKEINATAAALQDKYETLIKGTNNATTTLGRGLRSVQMALEKDFSLASMKAQIANIKGEKLTLEEIKHIEDLHKDIAEKTKALEDYQKKVQQLESENESLRQKKSFEKQKKVADSEVRVNKIRGTKEYLKKERQDLYTRLQKIAREQRSTLSANPIPYKAIPVLSRLARNYIRDGILSAEEIAINIHNEIKDVFKGATLDDVKEALYGKREKPTLNREEMALKAAQKKAQEKYDLLKRKYQLSQRTQPEVWRDRLLKWQRFAILSGTKTLGKLTSAATTRQFLTSPIEEGIGWGISKALPKVAEGAPREGGFNAKAEAKNITEAFKKATFKDIIQTAKTGKGELDLLYGKGQLPPEALDFFGQLHSALKTSPKRGEFFRSFEKRMTNAIANGADGTDPLVQSEIGAKAYEDAQRTIFMNDNAVVSAYQGFLKIMENKGAAIPAATMRFLLPIVKIPTNFISETASYTPYGAVRAAKVLAKGIDNLTPEQKDYVMRNLKKTTLGGTLLAIGYFNAGNIGGYYQPMDKRSKNDVQPTDVKMFGMEIPGLFLHAPALEMLQFGATIKRIQDKMAAKGKDDPLMTGVGKAVWGIAEQQPFVGEAARTTREFEQGGVGAAATNSVKGFIVPKLIQEFAGGTDKPDLDTYKFFFGEPRKRSPKGLIENIETGMPGLRETVPLKKGEESAPSATDPKEKQSTAKEKSRVQQVREKQAKTREGKEK